MDLDRRFGNQKADRRAWAITAWKMGEKVSQIARDLGVGRGTIYRWVRLSEARLSKNPRASKFYLDSTTKSRIIEAYVVLKRPSIRKFSESLESIYGIRISSPRLRRAIKKLGLDVYRPSALLDSLMRFQIQSLSSVNESSAKTLAVESSHRSSEHCEPLVQ